MSLFLVIVALAITLLIGYYLWQQAKQRGKHRQFFNRLVIGGFIALILGLTLTGKLHWLGSVFAIALLALKRLVTLGIQFLPLIQQYFRHKTNNTYNTHSQTEVMPIDQAYKVLGLETGVSRDMIIEAHRNLIQKLHPDKGGNEHLAAQINQAKEILLKQLDI